MPSQFLGDLREVYEREASQWDAVRSRGMSERGWLDRALAMTAQGDRVLDLGCGAGEPIAGYVVASGRRVHGVDFAAAMVAIAQARMPDARWTVADMRTIVLDEVYAAIIGWDSFFHLTQGEQALLIPRLAAHLAPGGGLLLTVGPEAGERIGQVGGEPVYHASFAPEAYAVMLAHVGIEVVDFVRQDAVCGGRSVLLGRRRETVPG